MTTHAPDRYRIPLVRALVDLSAVDLPYADQYLERAEVMLPGLCTRQQYLAARNDQESIPRLTNELRQATQRQDWEHVQALAQQAAQARRRLAGREEILAIADAVYGPRLVHADAAALALNGVVAYPTAKLVRTRAAILEQLRFLFAHDTERAAFYRQRTLHQLCRHPLPPVVRARDPVDRDVPGIGAQCPHPPARSPRPAPPPRPPAIGHRGCRPNPQPAICKKLGLDPIEFTVACVPFDAYLRLASQQGWGRQQSWTHFDGYQIARDLHLRALVGGDVRYGGPDDVCGVARNYKAERITARFAVLQRQRSLIREGDAA